MQKQSLLLAFILFSITISAQVKNKGIPFVRNYSPSNYNAGTSNWAIAQDNRGIMYFGNETGILEFDGTTWKMIAKGVSAITMEKNSDGIIYAGCRNDLGYLAPNDKGEMSFISLKNKVPDDYKNLGNCWSLTFHENKTIFSYSNGVMLTYDGDTITANKFGTWGGYIGTFNNKVFYESFYGLTTLVGDTIELVKNGELLDNKNIRNIFEYGDDTLFIMTRTKGFYFYTNNEVVEWTPPALDYIMSNQAYLATKISDNFYAIGTVTAGVLIMNKQGKIHQQVNEDGGMQSNDHCAIYADMWGNVWSGLEYGITNIFFNSAFSAYNNQANLPNANTLSMLFFNKNIYAGTTQGVFYKNWLDIENPTTDNFNFSLINENAGRKIWDMIISDGDIISGSSNSGTYVTSNGKTEKVYQLAGLVFAEIEPGKVIGSIEHDRGLFYLEKINEKWTAKFIDEWSFFVMQVDKNKKLWAFNNDEIVRLSFNDDFTKITDTLIIDTNA